MQHIVRMDGLRVDEIQVHPVRRQLVQGSVIQNLLGLLDDYVVLISELKVDLLLPEFRYVFEVDGHLSHVGVHVLFDIDNV